MLNSLIKQTEEQLSQFYQLPLQCSACDFLVAGAQMAHGSQGGVFFKELGEDLEIALYLSEPTVAVLADQNPLTQLSSANLNAFCVLVEELSHFHLIVDRKWQKQNVSQLELEWQAEVDKLLFSAIRLYEQNSDPHYNHLFIALYDDAKVINVDKQTYEEATIFAARLWKNLITYVDGKDNPLKSKALQSLLQQTYRASWQDKLKTIDSIA